MELSGGEACVRLARRQAESWASRRERLSPPEGGFFSERRGCFVSIHVHPGRELRGCIGFPEPVLPLGEAICEAAVHACQDPRFPRLSERELGRVVFEVSVLTEPEPLRAAPRYLPRHIETGRDGLIVRKGSRSGLLLPQVAVEYGFPPEEFLCQCCLKAGLPPREWESGTCEILCFQAEVFSESSPEGPVSRKGR
jgi:uncharacterized protein (TIGR00296 family)